MKVVLPLLCGAGILWFLFRKADVDAVATIVRGGIAWRWVAVSLVFALFSHVLRGVRWRLQLRPFGANPSTHDMSISIFGGYGLNLLFPRLGEIWRCGYVARCGPLPFATAVGTMVSERVVDMGCSLGMAMAAFLLERDVFFRFFADHGASVPGTTLWTSPWLWGGLAAMVGAVVLCRRWLRASRVWQFGVDFLRRVWQGVVGLRNVDGRGRYVAYSLGIWLLYYLNSYTSLFFFDFTATLGPSAALAIFVMGSLSLLVPVQGGLGAWHAVVIFTLGCYGIGEAEALSFVLVSWAIEQGFVLLLGVYALMYVLFKKRKD